MLAAADRFANAFGDRRGAGRTGDPSEPLALLCGRLGLHAAVEVIDRDTLVDAMLARYGRDTNAWPARERDLVDAHVGGEAQRRWAASDSPVGLAEELPFSLDVAARHVTELAQLNQRIAVRYRLGLDIEARRLEQVAVKLGCTRERVRSHYAEGIARIAELEAGN